MYRTISERPSWPNREALREILSRAAAFRVHLAARDVCPVLVLPDSAGEGLGLHLLWGLGGQDPLSAVLWPAGSHSGRLRPRSILEGD
jgi:hypothetical protein